MGKINGTNSGIYKSNQIDSGTRIYLTRAGRIRHNRYIVRANPSPRLQGGFPLIQIPSPTLLSLCICVVYFFVEGLLFNVYKFSAWALRRLEEKDSE